jgi:hypothetical protein
MNGFELFLPFILLSFSVFLNVVLYFYWIDKKEEKKQSEEKVKQLEERIKQLEEKLKRLENADS